MPETRTAHSEIAAMLDAGHLSAAIETLGARLRAAPTDHGARTLLAELLCLAGAFDRAEAQLGVLAQQTVDRPVAIARLRHLVRAASAREAWFTQGAVPALLGEPTPAQRVAMELAVAMRAGQADRTAELLAQAEALRAKTPGSVDGMAFDDLRDVDDRCAWFLEILTGDGGYMWVDMATVAGLRFQPAARPIDLLWREARMALHDGRVADIVIPAQYVSTQPSEAQRLAQVTDWAEGPGGGFSGTGQRLWLAGEEARGVLDLTELTFSAPP